MMADLTKKRSAETAATIITPPTPKRTKFTESHGNARPEDTIAMKAQNTAEKLLWPRPPLREPINAARDKIVFQQMECDYTVVTNDTSVLAKQAGTSEEKMPVIRLFGVTNEGRSVMAHVYGFMPYFYVPVPVEYKDTEEFFACNAVRRALNNRLISDVKQQSLHVKNYVLSVEIVTKESIMHFHNNQKSPFFKITVALPKHVPFARKIMEDGLVLDVGLKQFQTYESNILFALRYMVDSDMSGACWVEIEAGKYNITRSPISTAQIEIDVMWTDIKAHKSEGEWMKTAPLRILSFDIECATSIGFPKADVDPIIQIANMVTIQGQKRPFIHNVFVLNTCTPIVGNDVRCFSTEQELLMSWRDFVNQVDPDIIIGYNIMNFDLPYIWDRAEHLKLKNFPIMSRIRGEEVVIKDSKFSSKAYGTKESHEVLMIGRLFFDLLQVIQREYKLRSYTLNAVSTEFLGEQKEDVHHSQISVLFRGSDEDRRRLASYCLKDAYLPQRLLDKLVLLLSYMEMARVTGVPFSYLLSRGQSIKVLSQVYRRARVEGLLIPTYKKAESVSDEVGYEGAVVIDPTKGFYPMPIATLDFASLYPSIMMAHNLCYSTLITKAMADTMSPEDYTHTPANSYFVKSSKRKGVLPTILENLISARNAVKKEMAMAKDPFTKELLNCRQLAIKISANSVYGFTGATIGALPCLEISGSVTAFGREMIVKTRDTVMEKYSIKNGASFDAQVIYGDSVVGQTAILWKDWETKRIQYSPIDSLVQESGCLLQWKLYHIDKEAVELPDRIKVWTDAGWTTVRRIIRHVTHKKIMRITTHTGSVDVTEDHSLLDEKCEMVKPTQVRNGSPLLHADLPLYKDSETFEIPNCTVDCAYAWGFFMAEGSCGEYDCPSGKKTSWAISNADTKAFERVQRGLSEGEPHLTFKVLDTIASSGAYKLVPVAGGVNGAIVDLVRRWRRMMYDSHGMKRVPVEILNASRNIRQAFWDGFYAGDGDNDRHGYVRMDQKGQVGSAGLFYLAASLGYPTSINVRRDKLDIYRLTCTRNGKKQRKAPNKVKKILDLGTTDDFVYDLETENHHFAAGVGRMVVHNTDSVMVKFGTDNLEESMRLGKEAAQYVSTKFISPIKLEFEKCYYPYLLISKKRYAGLFWTKPTKYDKLDAKGIETVRRDNCLLVKHTVSTCLNKILIDRDIEGAKNFCKQIISELLQNKLDISLLVITKALSKEEYKGKQAHVELNKKLKKRNNGEGYHIGDRVAYVVLAGAKGSPAYERAEDPLYAMENNSQLDAHHYMDMLKRPLLRIFKPVTKDAEKELMQGDHVRKVKHVTPKSGGLMGFVRVATICPGCRTPLKEGESLPCSTCVEDGKAASLYLQQLDIVNTKEREFSRLWTQCQSCQGSFHQEVLCTARDCNIFYLRSRVQVDLKDAKATLDKFNADDLSW